MAEGCPNDGHDPLFLCPKVSAAPRLPCIFCFWAWRFLYGYSLRPPRGELVAVVGLACRRALLGAVRTLSACCALAVTLCAAGALLSLRVSWRAVGRFLLLAAVAVALCRLFCSAARWCRMRGLVTLVSCTSCMVGKAFVMKHEGLLVDARRPSCGLEDGVQKSR